MMVRKQKERKKRQRIESDEEEDNRAEEVVTDVDGDNPVEKGSDNESDMSTKLKRRGEDKSHLDYNLEEEDFDLLEENLGVKFDRRKRFKRIKPVIEDDSDGEETQDREAIAQELFPESESELERPTCREETVEEAYTSEEESDASEDDELDDFIVDEDDRPITEKKKAKPSVNDAALQEARETFGMDFNFGRIAKEEASRGNKRKPLLELYEPFELERAGLTEKDNLIRNKDIPERMQMRTIPMTPASEDELLEEALWIYKKAFSHTHRDSPPLRLEIEGIKPSLPPTPPPSLLSEEVPGNRKKRRSWNDDDEPSESSDDEDWGWDKMSKASSSPSTIVYSIVARADDSHWEEEKEEEEVQEEESAVQVEEETLPEIIIKIRNVLDLMRNQSLEVPFIAFHRKEFVHPEFTSMNDLWKIYRLDGTFCQLRMRKISLMGLFKNMQEYQAELIKEREDVSFRLISEDDLDRVRNIESAEELEDLHSLFNLYYSEDLYKMKGGFESDGGGRDGIKRRRVRGGGGKYDLCKRLGVQGLAEKVGLDPGKFAENLRDYYGGCGVELCIEDPVEAARECLSERLKTTDEALKAAKFMVATQLSREPLVRQKVREVFFEKATINVNPTIKGRVQIDESHSCYGMKYLKEKPVRELKNDQFLKLCIAEDDKMLTIVIGDKIKGVTSDNFVDEVKDLFRKEGFGKVIQDWNKIRSECVKSALEEILYPILRKELRAKLLEAAKEYVLEACSQQLGKWLQVQPYKVRFPMKDCQRMRVLSIGYIPDRSETSYACILTPDGKLSEFLPLCNIIKNVRSFNETDRREKKKDLVALKKFIRKHKPYLVVIGSESREARMILEDLRTILGEEGFPNVIVEIVDNELSKAYARSVKAGADFPDYPLVLRQAISLGRRMQDPLTEFSQLWNADEEILYLRFHPMQDYVSKEELLDRLQSQFVTWVNEVGVDINQCVSNPYSASLMQFVCGLGPRKATALTRTLQNSGRGLEKRMQLVDAYKMGPVVFLNCAAFFKINSTSFANGMNKKYLEPLDGTRIHTRCYAFARQMAFDALDLEEVDTSPIKAIEAIMVNPEELDGLDLDVYSDHLKKEGFITRSITLYDIRAELKCPYKDLRLPYKSPDAEELFHMLSKETPETLFKGKLTMATVTGIAHKKPEVEELERGIPIRIKETGMWQCEFCLQNDFTDLSHIWFHFDSGECPGPACGVRIRLENGVLGFIPVSQLSDKFVHNPEERVVKGQAVPCRILDFDVEGVKVVCSSRSSDLQDKDRKWKQPKDLYYDQETEDKDLKMVDD